MAESSGRLLDEQALLAYAVKLLAGRAHSTGQLREKLRRRAQQASAVDVVLARMKENGYLDARSSPAARSPVPGRTDRA